MPLLNTEQMEILKGRLQEQNQEEQLSAELSNQGEKKETPEKPYVRATQENQATNEPEDTEEEGHSVPYKRFKKVIESRNQLRGEIDYLKKEVEQLKSTPRQSDREFDRSSREAEDEYNRALEDLLNPEGKKIKNLEERLFQFEVAQEKVKLNEDLRVIREKYPEVPEQFILQTILQDPNLDTMKVAEQYSLFLGQIEEQGVAKYLKNNSGTTQPQATKQVPAAPRRLNGTGGASVEQSGNFGGVAKPNNLKSAHKAVLDFLKKQSF
jgi:hypothetical protein